MENFWEADQALHLISGTADYRQSRQRVGSEGRQPLTTELKLSDAEIALCLLAIFRPVSSPTGPPATATRADYKAETVR